MDDNKNNDNLDEGKNDNDKVCNNINVELIKMRLVMSWYHYNVNNASVNSIKRKNWNKVKQNHPKQKMRGILITKRRAKQILNYLLSQKIS